MLVTEGLFDYDDAIWVSASTGADRQTKDYRANGVAALNGSGAATVASSRSGGRHSDREGRGGGRGGRRRGGVPGLGGSKDRQGEEEIEGDDRTREHVGDAAGAACRRLV